MTQGKSYIIGLTGGIASGKSVATDFLLKQGVHIIDADILARKAIENGSEGESLILEAFGTTDRKELRQTVFENKINADKLDAITHPIIIRLIEQELKAAKKQGHKVIVLVAPLLFECDLQRFCDQTWQVSADIDIRIKRAQSRDTASIGEIKSIIARQLPDKEREKLADKVIYNNDTVAELERQLVLVISG
ncbi:MAG: dephospho-CoA kinase [Firmicutes bacterium]|nr:dephospho-CoA kinase [Bacillota bacterium]